MIFKYPKVRFLLGGTGNQLHQYMTSNPGSLYSNFFNSKFISILFKLSNHERFIDFPSIGVFHLMAIMPLVLIDLFLSRFFSFSIFTNFDINFTKSYPLIHLFDVGYFLNHPYQNSLPKLNNFDEYKELSEDHYACIHIRGGDLLNSSAIEKYGKLDESYYKIAISNSKNLNFIVITDDIPYAKSLLANFDNSFEFKNSSLIDDFYTGLHSKYFISSNSTLSYWIVRYRESFKNKSIVPNPFWKTEEWQFNANLTKKINFEYE